MTTIKFQNGWEIKPLPGGVTIPEGVSAEHYYFGDWSGVEDKTGESLPENMMREKIDMRNQKMIEKYRDSPVLMAKYAP